MDDCNLQNILPALRAIRGVDPKLAFHVAERSFNAFDRRLRLASAKEVTEMLCLVAEVGYRPKKHQAEKFLDKLLANPDLMASSDLVNMMRALGKMGTDVNGTTIDR